MEVLDEFRKSELANVIEETPEVIQLLIQRFAHQDFLIIKFLLS
jgi:hypothetical protein